MKKIALLFLSVAIFTSVQLSAQIRKVPAEVTEALKQKFPNADKVEWKDKLTNFQATFMNSGAEYTVEFTTKGEWKETMKKLDGYDALPKVVKDGFEKSKYTDWTKGTVYWIENSDNKNAYRIYVEKSAVQKLFLFFGKDGQLERETPGV